MVGLTLDQEEGTFLSDKAYEALIESGVDEDHWRFMGVFLFGKDCAKIVADNPGIQMRELEEGKRFYGKLTGYHAWGGY
jgi:hypothetical protein